MRVFGGNVAARDASSGEVYLGGDLGFMEEVHSDFCRLTVGDHATIAEAECRSCASGSSGGLLLTNHLDSGDDQVLATDGLVLDSVVAPSTGLTAVAARRSLVLGSTIRSTASTALQASPSYAAYGRNVINGTPPVAGTAIELGTNVCGDDTSCP